MASCRASPVFRLLTTLHCAAALATLPLRQIPLPAKLHAPSVQLLASKVRSACTAIDVPADGWLDPENVASAAAAAIATIALPAADSVNTSSSRSAAFFGQRTRPLPPQGEFDFGGSFDAAEDGPRRLALAEPAAFDGDARAQQTMGLLLYYGVGGATHDPRSSAYWHAAAAAQGNIDALATLGGCVRRGVGAERDEPTGIALIEAAAAAGSPVGLCKLGVLLEEGSLPERPSDAVRAAECFAKAAAQGSAMGLFNHGWALLNGVGTRRDVESALKAWYRAVARCPDDGAEEAAFHIFNEQVRANSAASALQMDLQLGIRLHTRNGQKPPRPRPAQTAGVLEAANGRKSALISSTGGVE